MSGWPAVSHIWKRTGAASETTYRSLKFHFGRYLLRIHAPTSGYEATLELNGGIYSYDHFVEPRYKLGNIRGDHILKLT